MNYNPDFFIPKDIEDAKSIILTKEGSTTEIRWEMETKWTVDLLSNITDINSESVVLDWGCGIGRLSKALINKFGCRVAGVDLQPKMIEYAINYVNDDRFIAINYEDAIRQMPSSFFTHAISVWVLQHSNKIQYEIPLLSNSLLDSGALFVLENISKAIPNETSFYDDGIPTKEILNKYFKFDSYGKIPLKYTTKAVHDNSWWALLSKNKD